MANFYDTEVGVLPVKIEKPSVEEVQRSKGFSVLNEQRLKEHERGMERDVKFQSNQAKFYED